MVARHVVVVVSCAFALVACGKKDDKELEKAAEKVGEEIGAKIVTDMTKTQFADTKEKHGKGEDVSAECSGLLSVRSDVEKDKSPEAATLVKDITSFCVLDVKVGGRVAKLKADYDEMMAAQKKKDRTGEQMSWASFSTSCESIKGDFDSLKEDKLEADPKAKSLKDKVDEMCTPENVARKKYFT